MSKLRVVEAKVVVSTHSQHSRGDMIVMIQNAYLQYSQR